MVKFFDNDIKTEGEWLDLMGDDLAGSCMNTVSGVMHDEHYLPGIEFWSITEEDFERYLVDEGIYECNQCGWWTYPGEGDGTYCDDCHEDNAEEED